MSGDRLRTGITTLRRFVTGLMVSPGLMTGRLLRAGAATPVREGGGGECVGSIGALSVNYIKFSFNVNFADSANR